jgi:hypothetical protein
MFQAADITFIRIIIEEGRRKRTQQQQMGVIKIFG